MTRGVSADQRESVAADPSEPRPHRPAADQQFSIAVVILPLHLFLLAGWARAAAEKVIDPQWWTSVHLREFLAAQRPDMLPWFGWLSDHVLVGFAPQVAVTVLAMQIGIVICLATNHRVRQALWAGVLLNVCFTMAGRVNPSAFYLVMQLTMLAALSRPVSVEVARRRAGVWLTIAALVAPFARTIHPRDVIDDPALMLAFVASLAAVTTIVRSVPVAQVIAAVERTAIGRVIVARLRDRLGMWAGDAPNLKRASVAADGQGDGWDRTERA